VGAGNQVGFGNQKERKRNAMWREPVFQFGLASLLQETVNRS